MWRAFINATPAGTDSEDESMPSTCSQPSTKRPKPGGGILAFLKKEAEMEEPRDAALYQQKEWFLSQMQSSSITEWMD